MDGSVQFEDISVLLVAEFIAVRASRAVIVTVEEPTSVITGAAWSARIVTTLIVGVALLPALSVAPYDIVYIPGLL